MTHYKHTGPDVGEKLLCSTYSPVTPPAAGLWFHRLRRVIYEEFHAVNPRLLMAQALLMLLPHYVGNRLRARVLDLVGFRIGRGTMMADVPAISGTGNIEQRLVIGRYCWFNVGCVLELEALITIGDRVAFGHQVMILTSTHSIGSQEQRARPALVRLPVRIDHGAWLGARSIVLPGVTVGAGAVVAAGALVNRDVPPNTLVAGIPARIIKTLS
jgi:maltose O-acetyltransferase